MGDALGRGNDIDLLEAALNETAAILGPFKVLFDFEPREVQLGRRLHFKLRYALEGSSRGETRDEVSLHPESSLAGSGS
jgi:hypothetical protein